LSQYKGWLGKVKNKKIVFLKRNKNQFQICLNNPNDLLASQGILYYQKLTHLLIGYSLMWMLMMIVEINYRLLQKGKVFNLIQLIKNEIL